MSDWTESILKKGDGWAEKIRALRAMLKETGPMWPGSTQLAGYGQKGPYHCGNCKWLSGNSNCSQPVVIADDSVRKDSKGRPIVNAEIGCCEFVEPK